MKIMEYNKFLENILQGIYNENQEGKIHPQEPQKKMKIGPVKLFVIENARDIGLDIEGYHHEITNYFIRHVLNSHGEEKKETSRGNIPIGNEDFLLIPAIIGSPDYIVFGARRNSKDRIIYIKHLGIGTLFYFEEILTGKSNKSLRGNTMYKTAKKLDKTGIIANIIMNGKTDISHIKITGMDGGQTINTANQD
jgi:hypothetical protein